MTKKHREDEKPQFPGAWGFPGGLTAPSTAEEAEFLETVTRGQVPCSDVTVPPQAASTQGLARRCSEYPPAKGRESRGDSGVPGTGPLSRDGPRLAPSSAHGAAPPLLHMC